MTPEQIAEHNQKVMLAFVDCQRAYQLVFNTPAGEAVLVDLAKFCRANETCVVRGDRDGTYVLEGRREVYLMIRDYLNLPLEELVARNTRPAKGAISHDVSDPSESE